MRGRTRPGGYETHYKQTTPPKHGLQKESSLPTPLARNKSKLGFNCDYCGLPFEKYACWARRTSHHYCGHACASAAKVIRIPKSCVVCNAEMLLTPTNINRVSTCSNECMRKRRTVNNKNLRTSPDYMKILKAFKKASTCGTCGTTNGPWVVRGIKLWVENGLSCADGKEASLVCKNCHLKSVTNLAKQSTYIFDRPRYYREKHT